MIAAPYFGRFRALKAASFLHTATGTILSFWDSFFDSDYRQRADIRQLQESSKSRARQRRSDRRKVDGLESRIAELEDQVGELTLLCRSLVTFLKGANVIVPEQFHQVMMEIDAEDGVVDGKSMKPRQDDGDNSGVKIDAW